ncbi:hypothetical protein CERZMDRAFT_107685 [Cercospora zeae-maydis SCOH1-5]|uniref:Uncharacterized protein n=1 Tax=Cercospora zeae-maydis SCOH1-5 TaxID=717836 RepID=A0A6A6F1K5_9PEZI|nr:hypothetical protein CERZMDRAFT_107685 [Cercospora zeae-maydis SCOH1-5]
MGRALSMAYAWNNEFGPETWEKRLLHIIEAHKSGASVRTHPSRGMAEYLFEEGMLSDEQVRDLRQQGYLDEELVESGPAENPVENPGENHSTAIEFSIRHRPDRSHELPQLDQDGIIPDPAGISITDVETVASSQEANSGQDVFNSNSLCFSAVEDDSMTPVWSPTAITQQQQAEVADLFALRSAVWHMAQRATDLSEPTKLPLLEHAAPILRPISPSRDSMDIGHVPRHPGYETQSAGVQRRNSWSGLSNRTELANLQRRSSSARPNSSRDWLQESDCIDHAQNPGSEDGTHRTVVGHFRSLPSSGGGPGTARRRPADDEDEENLNHGQDDWRKRRRLNELSQKVRIRFPCIFNIGERDTFPRHTATYEHISELLRHLTTHDFYACQKCFTKFDNAAETRNHLCRKISVEQWQQLFALQYPGQLVPTLPSNSYHDPASNLVSAHQATLPISVPQVATPALDSDILGMLSTNSWDPGAQDFNLPQLPAPRTTLTSVRSTLGHALQKDYQKLSKRLSELEHQRASDGSKREEILETLLLSVWEAFCETGNHKARPGGPLWRMMQRDAPGVLSQTTGIASSFTMLPGQQVLQNDDVGQGQQIWGNGMIGNGAAYEGDT